MFSKENLRRILENQKRSEKQWPFMTELVTSALMSVTSQNPNPLVLVDFFLTFLLTAVLNILLLKACKSGERCLYIAITLLIRIEALESFHPSLNCSAIFLSSEYIQASPSLSNNVALSHKEDIAIVLKEFWSHFYG